MFKGIQVFLLESDSLCFGMLLAWKEISACLNRLEVEFKAKTTSLKGLDTYYFISASFIIYSEFTQKAQGLNARCATFIDS